MSQFIAVDVLCPFFLAADTNRIKCEGPFKHTKSTVAFKSPVGLKDTMADYCCRNYEQCPIYAAAAKKYEVGNGKS